MAVLEDEPQAPAVMEILDDATRGGTAVFLPFIALMEVEYVLMRRVQPDRVTAALSALDGWPAGVVESTASWRRQAAVLKASGGLSLADAWIASLAVMLDASLVHKDPEFDAVPELRSERL